MVIVDIQTVGQLIGTYGFPIVAYGALFWYIVKENRENRKVIENNTLILTKILERITKEGEI